MSTDGGHPGRHRVVVVGGGFGGLQAAMHLRKAPVELTLIDRRNFHLFQPLTYQVATGALAASEVAYPLRSIFKRDQETQVLLSAVSGFDLERREVQLEALPGLPSHPPVPYDTLIVAGGSAYSYFGHDDWAEYAPEVKSLESALQVRRRILGAFEAAELETDPERREAWLTFVVVGAGPTGVEMAGQIAEIARDTLRRDFRSSDPTSGRILLVETSDRVLGSFPPSLSKRAARSLEKLGVTPLTGHTVTDIDADGVTIEAKDGTSERVPARTKIWAAGVTASSLAGLLAKPIGAELDKAGRLTVEPDLTLAGHPEVFAVGDMVRVRGRDGEPQVLPGVAPVAMQEGRYAARVVRRRLRGEAKRPFHYVDKGNLATIGRQSAVAEIKGMKLWGIVAWLTWLLVHLWYLVGFENRLLVFQRWIVSFLTRGRGARLITGPQVEPERAAAAEPASERS